MAALPRLIASFAGVGRLPGAPGTAGSLAALLLGGVLLTHAPAALAPAAVLAVALGLWSIAAVRPQGDPGWVVIDEVAGQWITLLPLVAHGAWRWAGLAPWLLAAFALFRLLDIAKPGPVGWADRREGPLAIMADDVIAGLLGATMLWAARALLDA